MASLLDEAMEAHGGLRRWDALHHLRAHARIGGGLWTRKGQDGTLGDVTIDIETHRQYVEYRPFGQPDRHSVYEPGFVAIADERGHEVTRRDDPRTAFAGHGLQTPWDKLHVAYFSGYAMWNYLTTPFLFRQEGFVSSEMDLWEDTDETWRRLHVRFPAWVATHCPEQVFYFGQDGLLRRHDYTAEITGAPLTAHLTEAPVAFDGIVFPTSRRVYRCGSDNRPVPGPPAVSIDILDVSMRE